jgi:hypothetical protein
MPIADVPTRIKKSQITEKISPVFQTTGFVYEATGQIAALGKFRQKVNIIFTDQIVNFHPFLTKGVDNLTSVKIVD